MSQLCNGLAGMPYGVRNQMFDKDLLHIETMSTYINIWLKDANI